MVSCILTLSTFCVLSLLLPLVPITDPSVAICFLAFSLHVQTTVTALFDYINNNNNNTKLLNKVQAHDESGFVPTILPIGIVLSN